MLTLLDDSDRVSEGGRGVNPNQALGVTGRRVRDGRRSSDQPATDPSVQQCEWSCNAGGRQREKRILRCAVEGRAALSPTGSSLRVAQRVRTDEIVRAERNERGDWCCNRVVEEQRGTHGCGVRRNSAERHGTAECAALAPPPGTSGTNRKAAPGRWMLNTGLYQY